MPASAGDNYERLEFLGDRVLGLVIAARLYERYPERARRQAVAPLQCAGRARDLRRGRPRDRRPGADPARQAGARGRREPERQCRRRRGRGADRRALLDGGLEAARALHPASLGRRTSTSQARAPQHPKSALQELAAAHGLQAAGLRSGRPHRRAPCAEVHDQRVGREARRSDRRRHRASRKRRPPRPQRCWSNCNERNRRAPASSP